MLDVPCIRLTSTPQSFQQKLDKPGAPFSCNFSNAIRAGALLHTPRPVPEADRRTDMDALRPTGERKFGEQPATSHSLYKPGTERCRGERDEDQQLALPLLFGPEQAPIWLGLRRRTLGPPALLSRTGRELHTASTQRTPISGGDMIHIFSNFELTIKISIPVSVSPIC